MNHDDCNLWLRMAFSKDSIKDFDPEEFVPRRVAVPERGLLHRLPLIARVYQDLRDASGDRVNITSGFRDPEYNQRIGGAKKSQHMYCTAADGVARAWSPDQVADWAEKHSWSEFMGIGRYDSFTHLDVRGLFGFEAPARWDNRSGS